MVDRRTRPRGLISVIMLLALASGAIDALAFSALGAVFASVMTGNLILLGLALVQRHPDPVLRSVAAIAGYAGGVLAAAVVLPTRVPAAGPWPPRTVVALGAVPSTQAVVLGGWLAGGARPGVVAQAVLLVLASFAMGVQSAVVNTLPVKGAATTYLTGTLTALATELTGGPVTWWRLGVLGAALAGAGLDAVLLTWVRPAAPALPLIVSLAVLALVLTRRAERV
jgi:uncharacterized membrane protein YoaK (UPF0700 family)